MQPIHYQLTIAILASLLIINMAATILSQPQQSKGTIALHSSFGCSNSTIAYVFNCTQNKTYSLTNLLLNATGFNQTQIGVFVQGGGPQTQLTFTKKYCQTLQVTPYPVNSPTYRYLDDELYLSNIYNGTIPQTIQLLIKVPTSSGEIAYAIECNKAAVASTSGFGLNSIA